MRRAVSRFAEGALRSIEQETKIYVPYPGQQKGRRVGKDGSPAADLEMGGSIAPVAAMI